MRGSLWAAAALVTAGASAGAVAAACSSSHNGPVSVALAPRLIFPEDVLADAASVSLVVYNQNSGVGCSATTGQATGVTSSTPTIDSTTLTTCPAGSTGKFCGTLMITESMATLIFAATAQSSAGTTIAYGCAAHVVDAATLSLPLTMIRNVPPATCGNGTIEPTEQCDPPGAEGGSDIVCDSQCHSLEETLSTGSTSPEGPPFLLWPAQTGVGGELVAFYTDNVGSGTSHLQAAMRVMSDALEPVTTPTAAANAILAPNDSNGPFPPVPIPSNQSQASAAIVLGNYFYVFTDDSAGTPDIHMRSFDATTLSAMQPQGAPIGINGGPASGADGGVDGGGGVSNGGGEANQQVAPAIAANSTGSTFFIAWQDVNGPNAGQIVGRTFTPTGSQLGLETTISTGTGNENVRVAATLSGWLVVWDDTTQIKMRSVSSTGTPEGPETIVSGSNHGGVQDHPGLAVLSDGRAAVVWADHGTAQGADIFVQRYDANVLPVSGDQTTPINDVVTAGDQVTPAIAGTSAAGGSFIAAWVDSSSGNVQARALDGTSGFDTNPVDGTTNEFQASIAAGQARENPSVAIGGAGPWAAIGWDVNGVISVRRFPTSTQSK